MIRRCTIAVLATLLSLTALSAFARDKDHGRKEHIRFDDNDRRTAHEWYQQHKRKALAGFRDHERLEAQHEALLREGYVLDPGFRARIRSLPSSMRLPPPPRQQRYVVIGGHVVLIDKGYHVYDVIHLEQND